MLQHKDFEAAATHQNPDGDVVVDAAAGQRLRPKPRDTHQDPVGNVVVDTLGGQVRSKHHLRRETHIRTLVGNVVFDTLGGQVRINHHFLKFIRHNLVLSLLRHVKLEEAELFGETSEAVGCGLRRCRGPRARK